MSKSKCIIGIMGLFASGKSSVADVFTKNGYMEIDVDKYGYKALIDKKTDIISEFGTSILDGNSINRKKLGEIVFSSKEKIQKLNDIVHPYMKKCIEQDINNSKSNKIVINAALLLSMKLYEFCDKIIYIDSPIKDIINRGIKRDKRDKKQIEFILSNQPNPNQLQKKADYIIYNNKSLENLILEAENLLKIIESEIRRCQKD